MVNNQIAFNPDYPRRAPGAMLKHVLDENGVKIVDFAKRCGRPTKTISEIIGGHTSVTPETALQFERVLGIDADTWLNLEAKFRLQEARVREQQDDQRTTALQWAKQFNFKEMKRLGFFDSTPKQADKVDALLRAFGVSSIRAWTECWDRRINLSWFKQHPTQKTDQFGVAVWLRKGELVANNIETTPYSEQAFKTLLPELRALTRLPWADVVDELVERCAAVGVAVAPVPYVTKTFLRGAAYWATKDKAVIVLSDQFKREPRIWFAFFHEAAHILLHSKKSIFIDQNLKEENAGTSPQEVEDEADDFSAEMIIPQAEIGQIFNEFGDELSHLDEEDLAPIAERIGVSMGLLVARLQHDDAISYNSPLMKLFREVDFEASI